MAKTTAGSGMADPPPGEDTARGIAQDQGPAPADRGARRRDQLVRAGVGLLGERGWAGVTARAVAERAGTHAGLVHYHFGGLPAFKREVASLALRQAAEPALELLTSSGDWPAGLAAVLRASASGPSPSSARVSAELITASLQDDEVAVLMRDMLKEARDGLVPWLRSIGAPEPEGLAVLLVAMLDGVLLHRLADPSLPLESAAAAAAAFHPGSPVRQSPSGRPAVRREPRGSQRS